MVRPVWKLFNQARRISELEEELSKVKRRVDEVELDWANYLDKFKRIVNRIAKRAEIVENHERQEADELTGDQPAPLSGASPTWARLTPRQRQVQMSILQRRANGGG